MPFTVANEVAYLGGDMAVGGEEPDTVKLVQVVDATGLPFCYVAREDCVPEEWSAATARAYQIVAALNALEAAK